MKVGDPLYGVLSESQVGLDPLTGRPRIVDEMLAEMRGYIINDDGVDRQVKAERVRASLKDLENDYFGQKTILILEPPPIISQLVDRGKGHIFNFETQDSINAKAKGEKDGQRMMADAIRSGVAMGIGSLERHTQSDQRADSFVEELASLMMALPGQA
ncbi:unnamed protein product [Arabis nemorensis]|uniref:Uncharacterized protein n=1 Tax=Arabis nemorensis TaxID=586526 RepID=A0A565AW12_9BRAS|nr:unnamed protein product [Arabis nemorensis]